MADLTPRWRGALEGGLGEHLDSLERERVVHRTRTHLDAALGPLRALYGHRSDFDTMVARALALIGSTVALRKPALRMVDARREVDPAWFQRPDLVGYVAYAERFAGTLSGVTEHLDYLAELRVSYLHLMSVIRPRPGANDGGFAISDYCDVDPRLGAVADLERLADEMRARGISLCIDLVMNHTADDHAWARAARSGSAHHRDYYLVFPDRTMPDRYERTLPEVFPEMAPGNFTWDDGLQAWVWTTFNTYQWDLNYANPEVFLEMLGVMLHLANLGVDVLRLDAIAFTWKRLGTNCQNQPEAHLIAQAFRALVRMAAPGVLLKAEAIVAPDDLVQYLGAHALERDECHLAYHNQLMVMLWSSLATRDARLATEALAALPQTPSGAAFASYVRCHDDIGWAVADDDAARVGVHGADHRRFLAAFYRGAFPGSFADGAPFSPNPEIDDERTCGSAAALCGISRARRTGDGAETDRAVRRLLLLHAVACSFGGVPLLYMGDELALDNDLTYVDVPERAADSRWMHRPAMNWATAARRHDPTTVEHRVFRAFQHLIDTRRATVALASGGHTWMHRYEDPAIFAFVREHAHHGRLFAVANISEREATLPAASLGWAGLVLPVDALGGLEPDRGGSDATIVGDELRMAPLSMAWFTDGASELVLPVPGPR